MLLATLLAATLGQIQPQTHTYHTVGGVDLKMDVYRPTTSKAGPSGAVVAIHGGAWVGGTRDSMAPYCIELAKRGVLAATITYRLADTNPAPPNNYWPLMIDDAQSAVRFLRANANRFGIDPNRIGAIGGSAGAQLAMLLGTTDTRDTKTTFYPAVSSRVKVVVDIVGPTNLAEPFPAAVEAVVFPWVTGKPRAQSAAEIRSMSPLQFVDARTAPMFIVHGTEDELVPVAQATAMKAALEARRIPVQIRIIQGARHDLNAPGAIEALFESVDWLANELKSTGTPR